MSQLANAAPKMNEKVKQFKRFRSLDSEILENLLSEYLTELRILFGGTKRPFLEPIEAVRRSAGRIIHKLCTKINIFKFHFIFTNLYMVTPKIIHLFCRGPC